MNIHVIRDNGFPVEQYEQVMKLLEATAGLISFLRDKTGLESTEASCAESLSTNMSINNKGKLTSRKENILGYSFDYFHTQCEAYREQHNLPAEDFVILLTPKNNSMNHLAAFQDDARNVFIKTSEWGEYLECSPVYPITFTVMTQVLQKLYCKTRHVRSRLHKKAEGCINDFCQNKKEVIFKFRTADICPECLQGMLNAGLPQEYFLQAFPLFEKMRTEMLFKQRHKFIVEQRKIHITRTIKGGQGITINLPEINKQINLNPKESALYLFYLTTSEGVPYAQLHFNNHRKKLLALYSEFCEGSKGDNNRAKAVIDALVNNENNQTRDPDLGHMRKKFTRVLGGEIAKQYYINGLGSDRDLQKGIRLNRNLVSYDDDIIKHILGDSLSGENA